MSRSLQFVDGGRGEPVVLLHAFPLDGRMWEAQARDLGRRARVIVPDLPGFGRSGAEPAGSLDQMADRVAALLDALGVQRATVVGLSMGGYVALAFARLHRGRLARLGLCDTRAAPDTPEGRAARNDSMALVDAEGVGPLVERMLPKLLSSTASGEVREFVRVVGRSQSPVGVKAALAAMRDRADARAWLAAIDVPTSVLVGADDTLSPPSESESIVAALPRAELERIPLAGHLANLQAPAAFTAALERLLAVAI